MPDYYLTNQPASAGVHEVHQDGCTYLPGPDDRTFLGKHGECHDAVEAARQIQRNVDGCFYCATKCHTR